MTDPPLAPRSDPAVPVGGGSPPLAKRSLRWAYRGRGRGFLAGALVVLSCLGVLVSSVSIWAHRTVFNTDQWVATVGPLAQNEAVVASASQHVTRAVDQVVKPQEVAERLLPPRLEGLAPPIAQGFGQIVATTVSHILHSDQFQRFWIEANRALQPRVAAALKGQPTALLATANGTIQLNYLPVVSKALVAIQKRAPALVKTKGPIPTVTSTTPVDEARSELSQALGRPLPPDFGVVTIIHSDQLAAAQHVVRVFNTLIIALVIVTAVSICAAIAIARRRRRAVIALALGVTLAMGLAIALTKVITSQVGRTIADPQDRGAVRATVGTIVGGLDVVTGILIGAGLLIAAISFAMGSSRLARGFRRHGAAAGRSLTGRGMVRSLSPVVRVVGRHRAPLAVAGLAVAIVILLWVVDGWIGLVVTVVLVACYEGLIVLASGRARSMGPLPESATPGEEPTSADETVRAP